MTISYQSRSRSSKAVRLMAMAVLLVLACAAWLGLDGLAPDAPKIPSVPPVPAHVWGTQHAEQAEATAESPFGSGANAVPQGGLSGLWIGSLDMGTGNRLQFGFNLRETGGALSGTAKFPIGEANIEDGKVVGTQLSFTTRHRMAATGQPLITQFKGELSEGMLLMTLWSEGAQSHLTLRPFPGR